MYFKNLYISEMWIIRQDLVLDLFTFFLNEFFWLNHDLNKALKKLIFNKSKY